MRRIHTKLATTYILLALLSVSATAIIASIGGRANLTKQKTAELSARIDVLAPLLAPDGGDTITAVDRHVKRLARAMDLRITLLDESGRVLIDSDVPLKDVPGVENHRKRPEVRDALLGKVGSDLRMSHTVNREFLYVARTQSVPDAGGILATVRVIRLSAHVEDIRAAESGGRSAILLAALGVIIVAIAVSFVISRKISNPMVEIARAVDEIRAGNLDTRITVAGDDEIMRVARAVNEMVGKLKDDIIRLKKLERVRSEFLGNVSHELRTPIFSLQGFLETLMEGAIDDPSVNRDFLQKAYHHSVRLNTLLGDLITISHIESGEMKMSFRYFNLLELLQSVVDEFMPVAESNKVRLRLAADLPAGVEVLGDKERLQVVFENLFENAIKYNKPGGEVVASFLQQNGKVNISVADTGVGIAAEHRPRIFERFYRVDRNRSREVGGTGLGLAIVKHIIEAHGSSVQIDSDVGKGSVFSFSLKT